MSNQPVGRYKNPEKVFNDAIKNCEHSLKVIYNVIEDSLSDRLKEYKIIYKKKSKKTSIIAPYKPFDIYWKKRTKLIRSLMKDAVTSKINDLGIDKNYYKHRYPTRGSKKDAIEKYEDFEEYSFSHRWHDIMKVVSDLIWGDIYAEGFAIAEDDTCPDIAAIKKELGVEVKGPKEVNIADLMKEDAFFYSVKNGILSVDFYKGADGFDFDDTHIIALLYLMSDTCLKS